MCIPRLPVNERSLVTGVAFAALLLLPACTIRTSKGGEGEDKKVDIQTPIGGIHVSEDADVRDVGLPVYPGAKQKEKEKGSSDSKSANVNISGPGFGVKVVAIEYLSNDPPQKLVDYYKDQLKKYGSVLECRTSQRSRDVVVDRRHDKSESQQLTCNKTDSGNTIELKVGVKNNKRIVAVEPEGKGSSFALVYVRTRGKDGTI